MVAPAPALEARRVEGVIADVRSILDGAKRVSRRSYWLSWFAWGFVFALYGGYFAMIYVFLAYPSLGTSLLAGTVTGGLAFTLVSALAFLPCAAFLFASFYEIRQGRRDARRVLAGVGASSGAGPAEMGGTGWTPQVVEAQKLLSHAKSETEFSFLPLTLGMIGIGSIVGLAIAGQLGWTGLANLFGSYGIAGVLTAAIAYPLYRVAQGSVKSLQQRLDRQVQDVTELEEQFLARFTGSPA